MSNGPSDGVTPASIYGGMATEEKGVFRHRENTFSVVMELQVEADSPREASDRAMRWRDAVGMHGTVPDDFYWHLHHPLGC
jgi:hypothetical protein